MEEELQLSGEEARQALRATEDELARRPQDVVLLRRRALLLQHLGRYGEALNAWLAIRDLHPDDEETLQHIRYLEEILKYTNRDIFSDPNTHHDPWL